VSEALDFATLIQRVKAGDEAAATELVRQYEPEIRRHIRFRLTDPEIRRFLDSMDICQSVMAQLFRNLATGRWEMEDSRQLRKLLKLMVANKILDHGRKQRTSRAAAGGRVGEGSSVLATLADPDASPPSEILAEQEILGLIRDRLPPRERLLLELRLSGHGWPEIAAQVQGQPEALRKQLTRSLDLVSQQLGLEETVDDHPDGSSA
jgi:RNA polymerase sigma factor (sigma-70 family)